MRAPDLDQPWADAVDRAAADLYVQTVARVERVEYRSSLLLSRPKPTARRCSSGTWLATSLKRRPRSPGQEDGARGRPAGDGPPATRASACNSPPHRCARAYGSSIEPTVVLDLHGSRARKGVDIDALETFLSSLRTALREYWRAEQGEIPRKGGRPAGKEAAAAAFRLVKFQVGSGIATLAPVAGDADGEDLRLDDGGETLALTTLRQLLDDLEAEAGLADPVVEALGYARRAIGDDGHFGIKLAGPHERPRRVVIDEKRIKRLQRSEPDSGDGTVTAIGRLHMIEADPPNRRVGIRAQDGVDWTCTYPDEFHPIVTKLIERLVRVTGHGRRMSAATGRLRIETLDAISEHAQDVLFTAETVPVSQLRAEQKITRPQGLEALVDEEWADDEESRRFLEATLGETKR